MVWIPVTLAFWLGTATIPFFKPLVDVMPGGARGNTIAFATLMFGVLGVIVQFLGHERIQVVQLRKTLVALAIVFGSSVGLLVVTVSIAVVAVDVPAVGRPLSFAVGVGKRPSTCYCDTNEACPNGKHMGDAECIAKCLTLNDAAVESCWGRGRVSGTQTILLIEYLLTMLSAGGLVAVLVLRERGLQSAADLPTTAAPKPSAPKPSVRKILFLASNPSSTGRLALDEEARDILEKIRAAEHRESLELQTRWAVRPDDLLQALNEERPTIVHFSGHGAGVPGIVLSDDGGGEKLVNAQALKHLFSALKDDIRMVVLNACYSREQATAVVEVIDFVIGMSDSVGDQAARKFAAAFYRALGFGRSVKNAFDQGVAAIELDGLADDKVPVLLVGPNADPATILVSPSASQ